MSHASRFTTPRRPFRHRRADRRRRPDRPDAGVGAGRTRRARHSDRPPGRRRQHLACSGRPRPHARGAGAARRRVDARRTRAAGAALHDPRSRPRAGADRLRRAAHALPVHADGVAGGDRACCSSASSSSAGGCCGRASWSTWRRTRRAPPPRSTTAAGCAPATSSAPTACTARCANVPASRSRAAATASRSCWPTCA